MFFLFLQASEEQLLDDQEVNEFHWVYKAGKKNNCSNSKWHCVIPVCVCVCAGTVLILLFALLGYAWRRQPPYQAPIKVWNNI